MIQKEGLSSIIFDAISWDSFSIALNRLTSAQQIIMTNTIFSFWCTKSCHRRDREREGKIKNLVFVELMMRIGDMFSLATAQEPSYIKQDHGKNCAVTCSNGQYIQIYGLQSNMVYNISLDTPIEMTTHTPPPLFNHPFVRTASFSTTLQPHKQVLTGTISRRAGYRKNGPSYGPRQWDRS
jgi:hypothetical protein